MPLPTPVEMPNPLPVNSKEFDLNYTQSMSPSGAQFIQTIERAPPAWIAKYQTPPLSEEREQLFQAFIDSLEGNMVPFLAHDPRRPRPLAYKSIPGEPWKLAEYDSIQLVAADHTASTLRLHYFNPGAVLKRGDYISFMVDNAWYLYRATTEATADGIGKIDISVVPRPTTKIEGTGGIDVRLVRACCAMKILGRVQKNDQVSDIGPKYTFDAVQFKDKSTD